MPNTITDELLAREMKVRDQVNSYAKTFGLDSDLVRALITQESRFIADARSSTGAFGYGQFTNIAAKQVQMIAAMTPLASDLKDFSKSQASNPEKGIKAACATLWWLLNKKYPSVEDKKIQLEACLTFYNAGGKAAGLVVTHGGHSRALPFLKQLAPSERAQSDHYAPEVSEWYVAWHEKLKGAPAPVPAKVENIFDATLSPSMGKYRALVEALLLLGDEDPKVDCLINSRDGMTELTLIVPGDFNASKEK